MRLVGGEIRIPDAELGPRTAAGTQLKDLALFKLTGEGLFGLMALRRKRNQKHDHATACMSK